MSHQINHTKKPSLPSIHFLLNESTEPIIQQQQQQQQLSISIHHVNTNTKRQHHHKQSASISSLPSELQQLSLSAPAYKNSDSNIPERSENHQPSWMMMAPSSTPIHHHQHSNRSHTRSVSDLSMINNLVPYQPVTSRHRHQTHKRSFSANTPFSIMSSPKINNKNTLPYIDEHTSRAQTDSPPDTNKYEGSSSKQQKLSLFEALNQQQHPTMFLNQIEASTKLNQTKEQESPTKEQYENVMVARDEQTGRYYCPFCNKAFNRPSSLRIHTYSHTGEKPFVCQEEGCGRSFSVQSNMRRHLRVHRLNGRSKTK